MKSGQVEIHLIFPDASGAPAFLTASEQERAGRFRFEDDRRRWSACRSSLRNILAHKLGMAAEAVPIVIDSLGKPLLAVPFQDLHFNLSHCDGLAVVALSRDAPVGIDIEHETRAASLMECETTFCHPAEISSLPSIASDRALALLDIWTAKEALLKAVGTGLTIAPEKLRIDFTATPFAAITDPFDAEISNQRVHPLSHPLLKGYRGHLSIKSQIGEMRYVG